MHNTVEVLPKTPQPWITATAITLFNRFSSTHVLNHSSLRRRRHPLLSGGASQLQQGHTVLSTSEDERVRQTVPERPADFSTLAQRHHTQYLSSSAKETASNTAIWGTARLPPSQLSSGRLHEQKPHAVAKKRLTFVLTLGIILPRKKQGSAAPSTFPLLRKLCCV